jgi:hypothetical protein
MILQVFEMHVSNVLSAFKRMLYVVYLGGASRSLLAFDYLASVSPPSLDVG